MKLFTKEQLTKLLYNGSPEQRGKDHIPVVKLFTPDAGFHWLLTEIDPENTDIAFGLCDLGIGFPELGYVSLAEIATIRCRFNLPVERDRHFKSKYSIGVYSEAAQQDKYLYTNNTRLLDEISKKRKG